jgi:hypothetical protein
MMLNIAVHAPIPRAMMATTAPVNAGCRRSDRAA